MKKIAKFGEKELTPKQALEIFTNESSYTWMEDCINLLKRHYDMNTKQAIV